MHGYSQFQVKINSNIDACLSMYNKKHQQYRLTGQRSFNSSDFAFTRQWELCDVLALDGQTEMESGGNETWQIDNNLQSDSDRRHLPDTNRPRSPERKQLRN